MADIPDHTRFGTDPSTYYWDSIGIDLYYDEVVDDLHLFVLLLEEWEKASAAVAWYRTDGYFPIYGIIILGPIVVTPERVRTGEMYETVLHEMAHTLGFNKYTWEYHDLLFNPSRSNPGADSYFFGLAARRAFNQVGGLTYRLGHKVPVENSYRVPILLVMPTGVLLSLGTS